MTSRPKRKWGGYGFYDDIIKVIYSKKHDDGGERDEIFSIIVSTYGGHVDSKGSFEAA